MENIIFFNKVSSFLSKNLIRSLIDYRHVLGHYLVSYIYVCLYVQIAIKLLGFSVQEFAVQARDIPSVWCFFKYDLFSTFWSESPDYFYRIEFYSISDILLFMVGLDYFLNCSLYLFPYFISFITFF